MGIFLLIIFSPYFYSDYNGLRGAGIIYVHCKKKRVRKINKLYSVLFARTLFKASMVNFNMLNLRYSFLVPLIRYNQFLFIAVHSHSKQIYE